MAIPEPAENWLTVAEALGGGVLAWAGLWLRSYLKGQGEEGAQSARRGEIAGQAVGAAIIDRSAADAVAGLAGDVKAMRSDLAAIREIGEDQLEKAKSLELEQRLLREVDERLERNKNRGGA